MEGDALFIDYYNILQVDKGCDPKILESAYRQLAKMYHPDHTGVPDITMLGRVIEAYQVLRNADLRAEYDLVYAQHNQDEWLRSAVDNGREIENSAHSDADAHAQILTFLYIKRRERAKNAGVVPFYIQELLGCSSELFDFYVWYLKEKNLIANSEDGMISITVQGIDQVITMSQTTKTDTLLITQRSPLKGAR